MNPRTAFRFFLLGLVLATALIAMYGCAGEPIHGYSWEPNPRAHHCEAVIWHQVRPEEAGFIAQACHKTYAPIACAVGCVVTSIYSSEEARHIDQWGESLYDHEARHVLQGMRHPD